MRRVYEHYSSIFLVNFERVRARCIELKSFNGTDLSSSLSKADPIFFYAVFSKRDLWSLFQCGLDKFLYAM